MTSHIIIGGGLNGLFIAKALVKKGVKNIILIEKGKQLGGVLKSETITNPNNSDEKITFDFGIHFVLTPKNSIINDLILEDINISEYNKFDNSLMEGHVINHKLYDKSGCPNLSNFSKSNKNKIENELGILNKKTTKEQGFLDKTYKKPENLLEYFFNRYGKKATELIYQPSYEKFTGLKLDNLNISNKNLFVPSRLIAFDREKSKKLKNNASWDWRIAFSDCNDSESQISKYYPKSGGIYKWVEDIRNNLLSKGVKIYLETEIEDLQILDKQINYIYLSSGEKIKCEKLYWTIPSFDFLRLAKVNYKSIKPHLRKITVVHFLINKQPVKRPFWINFYDKDFISYRATLYDNFSTKNSKFFRISVEVIKDLSEKIINLESKVFDELVASEIIPQDSKKIWSTVSFNSAVLPIYSTENKKTVSNQYNLLEKQFENLILIGNRPDKKGGQLEILNQISQEF